MLLLAAIATAVPLNAQEDDEIVIGSTDLQFGNQVPLAGNKTLNQIRGISAQDDFSHIFCEGTLCIGYDDIGIGLSLAYVPGHFGGYGSMQFMTYYNNIYSVGAVFRPVLSLTAFDWQVYAGMAISQNLGFEVGTRLSANGKANEGVFSWLSGSVSRLFVNNTDYYTIGVSVDIVAFVFWLL